MDLNEISVFVRVVQEGGFTAAAKALGMPKSTVSRKVSDLEARLEARLLQRTTRKLSLTDAGRTYFDYCQRIVAELENAERAVASMQATPRGPLRVTAGLNSAYLGPIISDYLKHYPEVRLEVFCTGRSVDLVEERFDVGIRAGVLADTTLVARKLGTVSWFLVATAAYLRKRARPRSPHDLDKHELLAFGAGSTSVQLRLERSGRSEQIAIATRLLVDDFDIVHSAAVASLGVAYLPAFHCVEDLRAGRLERVLPDWALPSTPVHVVYPTSRHLSPNVKSFVEHLQKHIANAPWQQAAASS